MQEIKEQVKDGLNRIDTSGLTGGSKLLCLKYGLFPCTMYPLMLYEVAASHVEAMEREIS